VNSASEDSKRSLIVRMFITFYYFAWHRKSTVVVITIITMPPTITKNTKLGVKFSLRQATKAQKGRTNTDYFYTSLTLATREGAGWSTTRPGRLIAGKDHRYPLYRRLVGLRGPSGQLQRISPTLGFEPWTVQTEASRYTVDAILAPTTITTTTHEYCLSV
jgi:hypothetical protein